MNRVGTGCSSVLWAIRMEHIPTGIVLTADSSCFRSKKKAHETLLKRLKARLYMIDSIQIDENDLTVEYENV